MAEFDGRDLLLVANGKLLELLGLRDELRLEVLDAPLLHRLGLGRRGEGLLEVDSDRAHLVIALTLQLSECVGLGDG